MKNYTLLSPLSLLLTLAVASPAVAQGEDPAPKPEPCAVVQVDAEYRIIKKSEVDALKDTLKKEHEDAVEAHKEAVKAAKEAGDKTKIPAPKAKKLKVIDNSIEEADAKELVAKLQAKDAKKAAGKQPKDPAKKDPAKKEPAKKDPPKKKGG